MDKITGYLPSLQHLSGSLSDSEDISVIGKLSNPVYQGYSIEYIWDGYSLGIKREDEEEYIYVNLRGENGKSAYEVALQNGYIGSINDWLESLIGADGYTPIRGKDYWTTSDIADIIEQTSGLVIENVLPQTVEQTTQALEPKIQDSIKISKEYTDNKVPTKVSNLENDIGYLKEETDPTVPLWAKQKNKPTYTPEEVGALSEDTYIPNKLSDLMNDSGYLTEHQDISNKANIDYVDEQIDTRQPIGNYALKSEIPTSISELENDSGYLMTEADPTVPEWAKQENKPVYTADEVGATTKTYVDERINEVEAIAKGRATGYVFDTLSDLDAWLLNPVNTAQLVLGDNLYIRAVGVPDYWWDGNTKQVLETQKVDLSEYAKIENVPTNLSELTNDADYAKESDIPTSLDNYTEFTSETLDSESSFIYKKVNTNEYKRTSFSRFISSFISGVYAKITDIPTKVSQLINDNGYLSTETDPTVPTWAKATTKPTYTKSEVGLGNVDNTADVNKNVLSATKLTTVRTIGLSYGATGTPTNFNGSANILIPVSQVYGSYLAWGGKNLSGEVSPIDVAINSELGANRLALMSSEDIKYEYSNDGGVTWIEKEISESQKGLLTISSASDFNIGGKTNSIDKATVDDQMRITFTAGLGRLYTSLKTIHINLSLNGANGATCLLECRTIGDYNNNIDKWYLFANTPVSGWSAWNVINTPFTFGGSATQTSKYREMRLTFKISGINSAYSGVASILGIRAYGENIWSATSTLQRTGHLYSFDVNQNATFPNKVNAKSFNGYTIESNVPANAKFTDTVYDDTAVKASIAQKANTSDIPTKTSDLTNDSGYLTEHQDISGKLDKNTEVGKGLRAYTVDGNGKQGMYGVGSSSTGGTLVLRNSTDATINIGEPKSDGNATTKRYVDNGLSGKVDKEEGKSLISNTEISRLADVDNYDDTDVKSDIDTLKSVNMFNLGEKQFPTYGGTAADVTAGISKFRYSTSYYIKLFDLTPIDYNKPVSVRFIFELETPNNDSMFQRTDMQFNFVSAATSSATADTMAYKSYVMDNIYSYGYNYYLSCRGLNNAGVVAQAKIPVGIYFTSNDTAYSTYLRNVKIKVVEVLNATFEFVSDEEFSQGADSTFTDGEHTTSCYNSVSNISITYNGRRQTGDSDTYDRLYEINPVIISDYPLYRYKLLFETMDGGFAPISTNNKTSVTTNSGKVIPNLTSQFRIGGNIYYYSASTTYAVGAAVSALYSTTSMDARYALSYSSATASIMIDGAGIDLDYQPVYLKALDNGNASFSLDSALSETDMSAHFTSSLPTTEDGYLYIYIGRVYSKTAIRLTIGHPIYKFVDGTVKRLF